MTKSDNYFYFVEIIFSSVCDVDKISMAFKVEHEGKHLIIIMTIIISPFTKSVINCPHVDKTSL